ncbi:hypothetical protein GXW77_20085, partial [Roseomonas alkaliterrae]|nr:hypothetical protein [Neoroseomonas alkaliterrae]
MTNQQAEEQGTPSGPPAEPEALPPMPAEPDGVAPGAAAEADGGGEA